MAVPVIQTAWVTGEVAPALFGHVDLAREKAAASTMRNMYVGFRGGSYSRAGTAFVGYSKQTGRSVPPRTITFQFSVNQGLMLEFGNFYMRVVINGAFVTDVSAVITSLNQANPGIINTIGDPFLTGDWVQLANMGGMPQLNGMTVVIVRLASGVYELFDVFGNPLNTLALGPYTGGGSASRIYTLPTIYAEADLLWLKFTESADVMSLTCVNQVTLTEYPAQDLNRISDSNWTFTPVVPGPSVLPPTNVGASASATGSIEYAYTVTAVAASDGAESVEATPIFLTGAVDVLSTVGTITVTWGGQALANSYNVYKASPVDNSGSFAGALYGFAGTSLGGTFFDSGVIPDFSQVPPTHQNPFARGQVIAVNITANGTGYVGSVGYTIGTATGTGLILEFVFVGGLVTGCVIRDPGENYKPGDTVTITGPGTGATATLTIGAQSGTYPGAVAYFQERRAYAYTINNPDTYFMSQPGLFTNFDSRIPTIDSDAIIGSPWAQQVNGIQFMIATAAGLLVFTGLQTWLLVGEGSFATNVQAITPASQVALPQPEIGCSPTIQPLKINYDVLFFDSNSSFWYDQPYQLYALSEPVDLTQNSPHLFFNYTFLNNAWCRKPYKIAWAVRNDGIMLSLTWDKQQQVMGLARHDTNGLFVSCTSVNEPPVDALYVATNRFPPGTNGAYMIERFDNRLWTGVESTWCVDCGLALAQPAPSATLTISSATGLGAVTGATNIVGGAGYSAFTTASVVDQPTQPNQPVGPGTGAVPTITIVGGALATVTFSGGNQGSRYLNPVLVLLDPENENLNGGAHATLTLTNTATATASAVVFAIGNVGSFIRGGGGIAQITGFISSTQVTINILSPFTQTVANTSPPSVQPLASGAWTMSAPVTTIMGLRHLAGMTVTGLADGNIVPPTVVDQYGQVTLGTPASAVTLGLAFAAQLQSIYLDAGTPTIQGERKKIAAVTARIESSLNFQMGSNQPDGSTQNPIQIAPAWNSMVPAPEIGPNWPRKPYNALAFPLRTGDIRVPVTGGYATNGQVALQQTNPLPLNVLAIVPEVDAGDSPQQGWPKKATSQAGR